MAPVSRTYALQNAYIIQSPGRKIDLGIIVIKDGLIHAVGKNIPVPPDAVIIKADSLYVYAGFIDGLSRAGVNKPEKEANLEKPKDPSNPPAERAGITPDRDVRNFLDPHERSLVELRTQGFTAAHVVPYGVFLPGKGAIICLGGATAKEMVLVAQASLYAELSWTRGVYPSTVIGVMAKWRELYKQAIMAKSYSVMYASTQNGIERPVIDPALESFYPVIEKKIPVVFKAEKMGDLHRVLSLQKELGFSLVTAEVKEGWGVTEKIKTAQANLFLSLDLPDEYKKANVKETFEVVEENQVLTDDEKGRLEKRREEFISKYAQQAQLMHEAGLKFGFSTMEVAPKDIHANLRRMVAAGLSEDAALAALTTTPAEFFGLAERLGTIDKGKIANLVVTSQPYFSEKMKVRFVFVDGYLYECGGKGKGYSKPASEIAGTWSFIMDAPEGKVNLKIVFKKNKDTYTGYISGGRLPSPIDFRSVTLDGNVLKFAYTATVQSHTVDASVKGTLEGSSFKGHMTVGHYGVFPIEGTKDPEN